MKLIYIEHDFSTGWPAGADLFYECQICGVRLSSIQDGQCTCGKLFVDASGARAGADDELQVRLMKLVDDSIGPGKYPSAH